MRWAVSGSRCPSGQTTKPVQLGAPASGIDMTAVICAVPLRPSLAASKDVWNWASCSDGLINFVLDLD